MFALWATRGTLTARHAPQASDRSIRSAIPSAPLPWTVPGARRPSRALLAPVSATVAISGSVATAPSAPPGWIRQRTATHVFPGSGPFQSAARPATSPRTALVTRRGWLASSPRARVSAGTSGTAPRATFAHRRTEVPIAEAAFRGTTDTQMSAHRSAIYLLAPRLEQPT